MYVLVSDQDIKLPQAMYMLDHGRAYKIDNY